METGFRKWIIVVTIITSTIIELIDTTIVNVSINTMSGNLGASLEDTAWVITSYAIANVIIIPMTSFLANNLGRRNYYIGSIILFTICSFMCGQASGIAELVTFRFLQGLGGGALLSVSAGSEACLPQLPQRVPESLPRLTIIAQLSRYKRPRL